jgi:transposase InsO family protein
MTKKDLKDKRPIDLSEAQRKLNIEFWFAPPRAPHFQGLVERVVGTAKAALRPALRTALVSSEELRTIFAKTMGIINNFPIAYTIQSDMDFHYRPLTPNHFLMGQQYAELQAEDTTKMTAV